MNRQMYTWHMFIVLSNVTRQPAEDPGQSWGLGGGLGGEEGDGGAEGAPS